MNKLLKPFNQRTTVKVAAFLIALSYMASRVLGLLRDRLLAAHFGVGPLTDAYAAAFRIPDLLFAILVSGAFAVAFIPVLTEHWSRDEHQEAWEVSSTILTILCLATVVVGAVIFVFANPLTRLVSPGFDPFRHQLTVNLTRIMLITPLLFAISSVLGSIQQAFNRFFFYALASVFYNLGIIFGIVVLSGRYSIYGAAIGVVIGAALQVAVQGWGLLGLGYRYRFSLNWRNRSVLQVIKLLIPRSIDQGIDQINYTIQTIIGSKLAAGSLTAYYYANNLKNVPLVVFGSAIATAAFPSMAAQAAKQDRAKLMSEFVINARLILFLVIPSATVAFLMRGYIVRLLFGFGNTTTANILGWFAGTIVFQSLFFLVSRVYYALQDTRTPLNVSVFAIAVNVILTIIFAGRYGVSGLAMAQSTVAILETIILLALLKRKIGFIGGKSLLRGAWQMLLANVVMGSVIYILVGQMLPLYAIDRGFWIIAPKFVFILIIGAVTYLLPSYLLGLQEARDFVSKLKIQLSLPLDL